jgi:hypothetical protein
MLPETVLPYNTCCFHDQVYLASYLPYICLLKNVLCPGAFRSYGRIPYKQHEWYQVATTIFNVIIHGNRIPPPLILRNFVVFLKSFVSFTATTLLQLNSKALWTEREPFLLIPEMCYDISVLFYS